MPDDTPATARPRRRFRLPVGRLIALGLLLALAALWWWDTPRTMRLVETQSQLQYFYWMTNDGMVTNLKAPSGAPVTLALRDWRGKIRWQVTLPKADYSGWKLPPNSGLSAPPLAFSPDHRVMAAAIPQRDRLLVATWRQGKPLESCILPIGPRELLHGDQRPDIQVRDDGRVFLWLPNGNTSPILVIEGGRLIAQGVHATRLTGKATFKPLRIIAPDGSALLYLVGSWDGEYATLAVAGSRVVVTPYPTPHIATSMSVRDWGATPMIFPGGTALFDGKMLIRRNGTTTTFTNWMPCPVFGMGSRYLLQQNVTRRNLYRLYETDTGKFWQLPMTADKMEAMTHSTNGRYVLVREQGMPRYTGTQEAFMRLLFRIPRMGNRVRGRLEKRCMLCLYERPGRLRAILPIDPGKRILFTQLSPDGHHLKVIQECEPSEEKSIPVEIQLYAW